MSEENYSRYVDDILVAIANKQVGPNLEPINIDELHSELFSNCPPTWAQTIVKELERQGFGKDWGTMDARVFMINGAGLTRAGEVREARRPKSFVDYLGSFSRSDWIAIGAFLVSLIALFK